MRLNNYKEVRLTPQIIFAISLMYMASADGHIDNKEMAYLSTIMREDISILNQANKYIKKSITNGMSFNDFIKKSNDLLSLEQKECILINMIDLMLSDGENAKNQEILISIILMEFSLDSKDYEDYRNVISKKNDHTIFKKI